MITRTLRTVMLAAGLLTSVPVLAAVPDPEILPDSTAVRSWTLGNGLRVVTRHVPKAQAVAITVGYAVGTDDDPPGREGLTQVLGELAFLSAAGQTPSRARDELDSQRPLGWSYPVSRRTTLFTEVASVEQFPGVLSQIAARMRGVQPTREELTTAIQRARDELKEQLVGPPLGALYYQTREVALGTKDDVIVQRATGRGIAKLTLAEAQPQLQRLYVPANAVLSLAGNLDGVDVPALIQNLFGSIPAGVAMTHAPRPALQPNSRVLPVAGISRSAGVVGIIAPALDDTLHPSFYLNALLIGSNFNQVWLREQEGSLPSRHHYAIFDEPDLMRIFPPGRDDITDANAVARQMEQTLNGFSALIVTSEPYEELRASVVWLLGGPLPPEMASRARNEPALLHTMARAQAGRALWGGERFWADYRRRFESEPAGHLGTWLAWFKDPKHQVKLLMVPRH
jgi:Peptidase M16 inactive domain